MEAMSMERASSMEAASSFALMMRISCSRSREVVCAVQPTAEGMGGAMRQVSEKIETCSRIDALDTCDAVTGRVEVGSCLELKP